MLRDHNIPIYSSEWALQNSKIDHNMPCPGTLSKSIHLKLNNTKGQCILHLPIDNLKSATNRKY